MVVVLFVINNAYLKNSPHQELFIKSADEILKKTDTIQNAQREYEIKIPLGWLILQNEEGELLLSAYHPDQIKNTSIKNVAGEYEIIHIIPAIMLYSFDMEERRSVEKWLAFNAEKWSFLRDSKKLEKISTDNRDIYKNTGKAQSEEGPEKNSVQISYLIKNKNKLYAIVCTSVENKPLNASQTESVCEAIAEEFTALN